MVLYFEPAHLVLPVLLVVTGLTTSNTFSQSVGMNITGNPPDASALLDLDAAPSYDQGLLIPRMNTAQRDAIASPANSLFIYNNTTDCFDIYHAATSTWVQMACLGCLLPDPFSATSATAITASTFDANWTASVNVTTYYLTVDDNSDFSSPLVSYDNLSVGNVVTLSVTGLTSGTTYYYRVRAENSCGARANSNIITATCL